MHDPTAIELSNDPTLKRFVGTAIHGDMDFDVPYMSEITENLWTGGCTRGLICPPYIDHVVSLYPWEQYRLRHEFTSILAVRMYDAAGDVDGEQVDRIARWVNECRATGVTLVHCQAGLNRSALIAARALILEGMDAEEAIALLRDKRSPAVLCNKSFERFLLEYV